MRVSYYYSYLHEYGVADAGLARGFGRHALALRRLCAPAAAQRARRPTLHRDPVAVDRVLNVAGQRGLDRLSIRAHGLEPLLHVPRSVQIPELAPHEGLGVHGIFERHRQTRVRTLYLD